MTRTGIHTEIHGTVQGVRYRPWGFHVAQRIGVAGRVWDDSHGASIDVFEDLDALDPFVAAWQGGFTPPPAARVGPMTCSTLGGNGPATFAIAGGAASTARLVSIPAEQEAMTCV